MSSSIRFIDSLGFLWQVTEIPSKASLVTQRHPVDVSGWLYFYSGGRTLVLRDYPADWSDLDWHELERLRTRGVVLSDDVTRHVPSVNTRRAVATAGAASVE